MGRKSNKKIPQNVFKKGYVPWNAGTKIYCLSGHRCGKAHFYSATKHAVTALTEGIRWELREINSHIKITTDLTSSHRERNIECNNNNQDTLNILSFNCKNIKTTGQFFQEIEKSIDIILIQEHWLFHFELEQLKELHPKLVGVGKAVDSDNPIAASHVPRGYGGVAVLWQKSIDRYIKPLPDGSSRLQCIELTIDKPQIIISAYLPTKSSNDSYDIFLDCLDQIYEIVQKYGGTHEIIVGGDLNEDLYNPSNNSRRKHKLNDLMVECNLKTNSKGLTFINVNGIDTSEIDYFLYTDPKCEPSKRLIDLPSNVSDHHPISMRIKCNITREQQSRNSEKQKHKIRWNKVDKSRYEETISRNIGDFIERLNSDKVNIEVITLQAMDLLSNTAKQLDQKKTYGKNKLKLNVWNKEISESLEANKLAYKNWKSAGRPPNIDNILLTEKETH
ncbi:DHRS11 [Mytilus edulis]|uniref:DHRS11 n=1 Tax=Mytilus edulis TaxID=6550 RepID=A0A8S3V680_MYTED|nr:DHRS11 [Mytilus edulis]